VQRCGYVGVEDGGTSGAKREREREGARESERERERERESERDGTGRLAVARLYVLNHKP